jgi:hypothetical protein
MSKLAVETIREYSLNLKAVRCANGDTWEFTLTLGGKRMGKSVFRGITQGFEAAAFLALQDIIADRGGHRGN